MDIKRNGNQITYTDKNSCGAISIFKTEIAVDRADIYKSWIKQCAEIVKPNAHSFVEIEKFLFANYAIEALEQADSRLFQFKASVIINHFADQLDNKPALLTPEMTNEEIKQQIRLSNAQLLEAKDIPAERFNLKLHGYRVMKDACNMDLSPASTLSITQENTPKTSYSDTVIFMEETTGHIAGRGFGCTALINEIVCFLGVTQEDIDCLTPRFSGYIQSQVNLGRLPAPNREK